MDSYLIIKKQHSEKKNKDYLGAYLAFNGTEYMINLSNEILSIILNKTSREIVCLEVGYVSPKMKLEVCE